MRLALAGTSRLGLGFVLWLVEIESTHCNKIGSRDNEYAQIIDSLILGFVSAVSLAIATASIKFIAVRLSLAVVSGHCLVTMLVNYISIMIHYLASTR